jgi:hypothetical protein
MVACGSCLECLLVIRYGLIGQQREQSFRPADRETGSAFSKLDVGHLQFQRGSWLMFWWPDREGSSVQ